MQSLEIISVNVWLILISLCNLLILALILKKFLFKPVKKIVAERQAEYDKERLDAENALREAEEKKAEWEKVLSGADDEAARIVDEAKKNAQKRSDKIIDDANARSGVIVHNAEVEADLEKRRANEEIKDEIVEVSVSLAEKLVDREISAEDHKKFIDDFIDSIGDGDE